ncbi:acyl-CoA thioesterase [Sphingosinicella soli]|uniref:Acyl-CoA thioesterase-2 n=1 Tax=Sphingosinicella soli TaxID=333708 RepID=A0A7W7B1P0_9SPHN|nr:acyl-CoA thioesterase domain-containing protein [Sphingosinicella soli]MBB4632398.1 acyl-CoA thioesterase-2 [Sphingosinicella soli]
MLFAYEDAGKDRFRTAAIPSELVRLYGGQLIAQALGAMQKTVSPEKTAHSFHAYFGRPGHIDKDLDFAVLRDNDGRSFSTRRVTVTQDGAVILTASASFQVGEDGPRHQFPMPDVPPPEGLRPLHDYVAEAADRLPVRHRPFWLGQHQFEWRPVEPFRIFSGGPPTAGPHYWLKLKARLGDDEAEHQRYLTYVSDLHILHAGLAPLAIGWADDHLQTSSLDHALWFHDRFRVDEWLLYTLDSPAAGGGRALGRGTLHASDGRLVATVSQEGLIRVHETPRSRF